MKHILRIIAAILIGSGTLTATADDFTLDWSTIDSGGVMNATGDGFTLSGTIGQPDAMTVAMTGGGFTLVGGFWALPSGPEPVLGDLDCDGDVDFDDISPFVLALSGQAGYEAQFPDCHWLNADCDEDGDVDFDDISPFVSLIGG